MSRSPRFADGSVAAPQRTDNQWDAFVHFVMARLVVRATYSSISAAIGGPDKPGHDGDEMVLT
jgi:hypothetical protein